MKMLHVTIQTAKFDEELEFFLKYVGLKIQNDMRPYGRKMVFLADTEDATRIEIIEVPEGLQCGTQFISIGFMSENVEEKHAEMVASGYETTQIISPNPNVKFFFVTDPAGVRIQFM